MFVEGVGNGSGEVRNCILSLKTSYPFTKWILNDNSSFSLSSQERGGAMPSKAMLGMGSGLDGVRRRETLSAFAMHGNSVYQYDFANVMSPEPRESPERSTL